MPKPADIPSFIRSLHKSYEARTGYTIRYNMHRENQWYDWCKWADWDWSEADLARVIGYLRGKIRTGQRNDGALKFDNLIGRPDAFEEDLNLAKEAAQSSPLRRPGTQVTSHRRPDDVAADGGEIIADSSFFKALLRTPPPAEGQSAQD